MFHQTEGRPYRRCPCANYVLYEQPLEWDLLLSQLSQTFPFNQKKCINHYQRNKQKNESSYGPTIPDMLLADYTFVFTLLKCLNLDG